EVDEAEGRRLVVLEQPVADLEARRAVEPRIGPVAVLEGRSRHERLPRGARGELALGDAREEWGARGTGVQPGQRALVDAADPDLGVVRRGAGHRDYLPGLGGQDDRRTLVSDVVLVGVRVVGVTRRVDRLLELALDD